MTTTRVPCVEHARHWFARSIYDPQPWCVRCGAPNPVCAACGAMTHSSAKADPEKVLRTLCAKGHLHEAPPDVRDRQARAAVWRITQRRDRARRAQEAPR